jgi:16S rRNA (cytidine1402-2'-O)-methyltransferase
MPRLYVVATPIGNLSDMTPRAVETLKSCALIAAEDTRVTGALCAHFDIHTRLVSSHRHNEEQKAPSIIEKMLREDVDAAVVTDAGTPCISDPGWALVREAAQAGIEVLCIPGPTAMASALSVSGFDTREFAFYGFLPRGGKELKEKLLSIARSGVPVAVVHESPHRVIALCEAIAEVLPGAQICACCDLTKKFEKTVRAPAQEMVEMLRANPKADKGEYCLVLDLHGVQVEAQAAASGLSLEARLLEEMLSGATMREAGAALMEQGEKRNAVYRAGTRVKAFLQQMAEEE